MVAGWIKLHRQLLDHWVMTEPEAMIVWIRFLLEANHSPKKRMLNGALVEIKRGQLIFGLEAFSARSGVSISKLRRYLKLLQSDGMIDRLKTAKYSIITIASFDSYQSGDSLTTSKQQSNDKQTTTPKECKNVNNDKNKDIHQQIADTWNEKFSSDLSAVSKVTDKRKASINGCIKEMASTEFDFSLLETWSRLFDHASNSDFLMGRKTDWAMSFDFIITKSKLIKIVEGEYDN